MITSVTPYRDTFVVAIGDKVYMYLDGALTPLRFRDENNKTDYKAEYLREKRLSNALRNCANCGSRNCDNTCEQQGRKIELDDVCGLWNLTVETMNAIDPRGANTNTNP